ncbi:uncharacterized protein LOC103887763 isoform X1 [Papio anubis]|uniref:uncharacterized protein LOC103887763 isoform X1 n=1 Tax=Papio anubis TaxID=9555 RepID=UPI000B7B36A9|nr:uncharacterized protein LOC103887763 isoform X1 [Papio anubis]XP_031507896.1 uncharacterized protein LOC103887763 isoform X1 [Papio anubis]XP_031507897.1 uncharacterized protein LOC103887763 isoform X1 [Papio anubis]
MVFRLCVSISDVSSASYKDTSSSKLEPPILLSSFNLNYLLKGPVFKYSHLGDWSFNIQIWRRHSSVHNSMNYKIPMPPIPVISGGQNRGCPGYFQMARFGIQSSNLAMVSYSRTFWLAGHRYWPFKAEFRRWVSPCDRWTCPAGCIYPADLWAIFTLLGECFFSTLMPVSSPEDGPWKITPSQKPAFHMSCLVGILNWELRRLSSCPYSHLEGPAQSRCSGNM